MRQSMRDRFGFIFLALAVLFFATLPSFCENPPPPPAPVAGLPPVPCPQSADAGEITKQISQGVKDKYKPFSEGTLFKNGPDFLAYCLVMRGKALNTSTQELISLFNVPQQGQAPMYKGRPAADSQHIDNHEYGYANMMRRLQAVFDNQQPKNTYADNHARVAGWWTLKPGRDSTSTNPGDYYASRHHGSKKGYEVMGWNGDPKTRIAYVPGVTKLKKAAVHSPKGAVASRKGNRHGGTGPGHHDLSPILTFNYTGPHESGTVKKFKDGHWEDSNSTLKIKQTAFANGSITLQYENGSTLTVPRDGGTGSYHPKGGSSFSYRFAQQGSAPLRDPVVLKLGYTDSGQKKGYFSQYRSGRWEEKTTDNETMHFTKEREDKDFIYLTRKEKDGDHGIRVAIGKSDHHVWVKSGDANYSLFYDKVSIEP